MKAPLRQFLLAAGLLAYAAGVWAKGAAPPALPPGPTRTVEVQGSAVVTGDDVPGARRSAINQALRDAVEQTVGVYVSATTQTRNYVALDDRVYTRAAGFAVVDQVLEEANENGTYRVKLRATVSLKPLLEQLKAAGLTRQWRILVSISAASNRHWRRTRSDDGSVEVELERRLLDAGFYVVDWRQRRGDEDPEEIEGLADASPGKIARAGRRHGADILIVGEVATRVTADLPLPLPIGLGRVSYVRCKAEATVRAVRADTGEEIAVESLSEDSGSISEARARSGALSKAGRRLGDRFAEVLALLPGGLSRTMQVVISGFERVSDARRFEDALARVPGVARVSRQEYTRGALTLDVDLDSGAADRLPILLEESEELRDFRLRVESDTKSRVAARVATE